MAADLRERVARAIACKLPSAFWEDCVYAADAVLAELAPELQPQAKPVGEAFYFFRGDDGKLVETNKANHDWWASNSSQPERAVTLYSAPQPQPQPQPQASAEDVALVDEAVRACIDECGFSGETRDDFEDAWQRIRASLGVSNG